MKILDVNATSEPHGIVATIGFFDGVHKGHKYLIEQVVEESKKISLPSCVITFPVHPRKVLHKEYQPALLCSYEEKIIRLSKLAIDYTCPMQFTEELAALSAKEFMTNILRDKLNVKVLVIGYDHKFGHNRAEGFDDYVLYGEELGIKVVLANKFDAGEEEDVSSSAIRRYLAAGEIDKANDYLGYRYSITGRIVDGYKVGRTIGFPTANMEIWEKYKVIPALGVYAVHVYVNRIKYDAMLYIGRRPTLHSDNNISVEVNLFDFDGDLYGQTLTSEFIKYIRGDVKFEGVEPLKKQLQSDKETVRAFLEKMN